VYTLGSTGITYCMDLENYDTRLRVNTLKGEFKNLFELRTNHLLLTHINPNNITQLSQLLRFNVTVDESNIEDDL
jgi:hypothetical protein